MPYIYYTMFVRSLTNNRAQQTSRPTAPSRNLARVLEPHQGVDTLMRLCPTTRQTGWRLFLTTRCDPCPRNQPQHPHDQSPHGEHQRRAAKLKEQSTDQ